MSTKAYDTVKLARANKRPTGLDYIHNLCGDFFELHGDRCYADDGAIVGGIGHFRGIPVTMIAIEKGHSAKERTARSFGAPHPEGYRKALRLMRQAEKFHRPVLCFVDTSGAYCGIGAEAGPGPGHCGQPHGYDGPEHPPSSPPSLGGGAAGPWPCRWPTGCGCWRTRCTP